MINNNKYEIRNVLIKGNKTRRDGYKAADKFIYKG